MESINVLCFGDSLTEGYSDWGYSFTPYAEAMESWLKSAWPSTKINVDVEGLSGDLVDEFSGSFLTRIKRQCTKTQYDFIIILGGTNDLGRCKDPAGIFSSLEKVYAVAHAQGANILALTIPECSTKVAWLEENRNAVNEMIKGQGGERFYTLDLHALMPYHTMDPQRREKIWDGLHFTPAGYDVMGQQIANKLVELVAEIKEPKNLKVKKSDEAAPIDVEA